LYIGFQQRSAVTTSILPAKMPAGFLPFLRSRDFLVLFYQEKSTKRKHKNGIIEIKSGILVQTGMNILLKQG